LIAVVRPMRPRRKALHAAASHDDRDSAHLCDKRLSSDRLFLRFTKISTVAQLTMANLPRGMTTAGRY